MFSVVEIDKSYVYDGTFVPLNPYTFYSHVSITSVASYWTIFFSQMVLTMM